MGLFWADLWRGQGQLFWRQQLRAFFPLSSVSSETWTPSWSLQTRFPWSSHSKWAPPFQCTQPRRLPLLIGSALIWRWKLSSIHSSSLPGLLISCHVVPSADIMVADIPREDQGLWVWSSSYLSVGLIRLFFLIKWTIADTYYNVIFDSSWSLPYYLCAFRKEIAWIYILMLIFNHFTFFS